MRIVALVLAVVGAFGLFVVEQSVTELRGARVDATKREVLGIARSFAGAFGPRQLRDPAMLGRQLATLRRGNSELVRTSVYLRAGGRPVRRAMSTTLSAADPARQDDLAPLRTRSAAYHELTDAAGRSYAELNYPLGSARRPVAVLGLYFDRSRIDDGFAARTEKLLVLVALAALVSAVLVVVMLERMLFSPLRRLQKATGDIERGDTAARMGWQRRDELGALANGFDRMADAVQERERLEVLAMRDSLTGLSNHRHFHETLAVELHRAQKSETPLSLVLLDLDHFKVINDKHGHPVGDEVLRTVGETLRHLVRATDVVARLGGEEFAVLLPDASPAAAEQVAEEIRRALAENTMAAAVQVRCSGGVATFPLHAGDANSLMETADGALYWAKQAGRDQVRVYDPHHVITTTSTQRRAEIVAVLEDPDGIVPVFQPIVDLQSGEIAGYEALARFPDFADARTPDVWVAEAHRCGLGPDLEAQAVRAALSTERRHGGFLSVILSPSVAASKQILNNLPVNLDDVVVELTEHESLVGSQEALMDALDELRARGARIAVDDAGAGYAGLRQIMRLRPDIIKLDRDLVAGVGQDPARAALIECFVTFAGRTDAQICAEGIEDAADLRALAELGVHYAQGYLLARPAAPWAPIVLPGQEASDAAAPPTHTP